MVVGQELYIQVTPQETISGFSYESPSSYTNYFKEKDSDLSLPSKSL